MRTGKHPITGETKIYLSAEETEHLKEMIRGAKLPHRQVFQELLEKI